MINDIIKELVEDYGLGRQDIEQIYSNADKVVDFVGYMLDVKQDDYKIRGVLMETYYESYFNGVADQAYILKNMTKKHKKIEIIEIFLDAECKKEIIENLQPYCNQKKVWAFKILYEVFNGKNSAPREIQSGTDEQT